MKNLTTAIAVAIMLGIFLMSPSSVSGKDDARSLPKTGGRFDNGTIGTYVGVSNTEQGILLQKMFAQLNLGDLNETQIFKLVEYGAGDVLGISRPGGELELKAHNKTLKKISGSHVILQDGLFSSSEPGAFSLRGPYLGRNETNNDGEERLVECKEKDATTLWIEYRVNPHLPKEGEKSRDVQYSRIELFSRKISQPRDPEEVWAINVMEWLKLGSPERLGSHRVWTIVSALAPSNEKERITCALHSALALFGRWNPGNHLEWWGNKKFADCWGKEGAWGNWAMTKFLRSGVKEELVIAIVSHEYNMLMGTGPIVEVAGVLTTLEMRKERAQRLAQFANSSEKMKLRKLGLLDQTLLPDISLAAYKRKYADVYKATLAGMKKDVD